MMWDQFLTNQRKPIHKWAHYFPVYEELLQRYRNRSCRLLEIGCFKGGSLDLWKRYLGPYAQIVGIDIDPNCRAHSQEQIRIEIGSQADKEFLIRLDEELGPFDIVIDDGSHVMSDIATSFSVLYPRLHRDGIYIVEDLHAAYSPKFGGGVGVEGTFIEFTKKIIDAMHAHYWREASSNLEEESEQEGYISTVASMTRSLRIIDSLIAYEKGHRIRHHAPEIGVEQPQQNVVRETGFRAWD